MDAVFIRYGGVLVSAKLEQGCVREFVLKGRARVGVKNVFGGRELTFSNGQRVSCAEGEIFFLTVDGRVELVDAQ